MLLHISRLRPLVKSNSLIFYYFIRKTCTVKRIVYVVQVGGVKTKSVLVTVQYAYTYIYSKLQIYFISFNEIHLHGLRGILNSCNEAIRQLSGRVHDALQQDVEAVRARDKVERTAELLRDGVQSRFISVHFNNMRNV